MNSKKIIIVVLAILVSIGITISTYKNLEGTKVEEIEEKTSNDNVLTFHVQQDSGSYTEYTSGKFPSGQYKVNQDKTTCTDVYGNKINTTLKYVSGSVVVNGSKTVYCEVYLDKCKIPDIFKETYTEADFSQINACELSGDLYRYQGTDNVNNYLCFGTNEKDKCLSNPDKYMYRVIGLTSTGQMKIIKNTSLVEDGVNEFQWNNNSLLDYCGSTGDNCTWPKVMIYKRLNGISNGTTKGSRGDTNLYLNRTDDYYDLNTKGVIVDSKYDSVPFRNTWIELIEDHQWKYGDIIEVSVANLYNGDKLYEIENNFTQTVEAKIGLLYIHDYYYAYPGGNPRSSTVARNAWISIYNTNMNTELSITRYSGSPHGFPYYCGWYATWSSFYNDGLDGAWSYNSIRPVFFTNMRLCNSINGWDCYYLIGTGSSSDPLRIVYAN